MLKKDLGSSETSVFIQGWLYVKVGARRSPKCSLKNCYYSNKIFKNKSNAKNLLLLLWLLVLKEHKMCGTGTETLRHLFSLTTKYVFYISVYCSSCYLSVIFCFPSYLFSIFLDPRPCFIVFFLSKPLQRMTNLKCYRCKKKKVNLWNTCFTHSLEKTENSNFRKKN